jgi:hypothetical protein
MSMAFGLFENSELHLVPLLDHGDKQKHECEIIISPVPIRSWRSVCRVTVRLRDEHGALAAATEFLRTERINILLSECCSTYQGRAHFDAICDLGQMRDYDDLLLVPREEFEITMSEFLDRLTARFDSFARGHSNSHLFLIGAIDYVRFSALTGLNDASFVCRRDIAEVAHHTGGALHLPKQLTRYVSEACDLVPPALPNYALITGNTEQRYMRVLFLKDHRYMFRFVVDNDLPHYAGSGVGVLQQFLNALPAGVNLMRASNYIFDKKESVERGRIDLIGYWNIESRRRRDETVEECMQRELGAVLSSLVIHDIEGTGHPNALKLVKIRTAKTAYPRVYISYSIGHDNQRLATLVSALTDANYIPVLGTDEPDDDDQPTTVDQRPVGSDVMREALPLIDGCVALISLQSKREDYKVVLPNGRTKYIVPPWLTAEEMYAWSSPALPRVLRLREVGMDDSTFDRNMWEKTFEGDKPETYDIAVRAVVSKLNEYAASGGFQRRRDIATAAQFEPRFSSPEL